MQDAKFNDPLNLKNDIFNNKDNPLNQNLIY